MIIISESNKSYKNYSNPLFLNNNGSKPRIKRSDDKTLVEATVQRDYNYWLSQEDIADIARVQYNNFAGRQGSNSNFEILGSLTQLKVTSELFQLKIQAHKLNTARLSLIINLDNFHWVTLVITYQQGEYTGYYVDSKNTPIPSRYYQMLLDTFHIQPRSLSPGFTQQQDAHNCGLWALQNTALLNQMIDQNKSIVWMIEQLKKIYDKEYFKEQRIFFSESLYKDENWRTRHPLYFQNFQPKKNSRKLSDTSIINSELNQKKIKLTSPENEKINELLETFVESFLSAFIKRLSLYHLLAKGESITEEALIAEIKTGITGALLGISITLNLVGSIPSLVASLRTVSNKFFFSKTKAQRITKIFSEYKVDNLRGILSESGVNIFYSFESQFMQVTDKAGDKMAIEKLAEDAVGRLFNGIIELFEADKLINRELIEKSIIQGPSEKFFGPNIKRAQLKISGYAIQSKNGDKINTGSLFEKTGLIEFLTNDSPQKFYASLNYPTNKYGYRRLLSWEKNTDGTLRKHLKDHYFEKEYFQIEETIQIISKNYAYILDGTLNEVTAKYILNKIEHRNFPPVAKKTENKEPIYFDLRKPVKNFSGRATLLETLHDTLMSEMTTAIVPAWSSLSISPISPSSDGSSRPTSGSQLSLTGLGGIGKTQLALRYAEVYAKYYDHNVLWIDSETKKNLAFSFHKLANKLKIPTKDQYGLDKSLEEITEETYEYFSDRKSLFILDNVENYRAIEAYLPKSRPGNKPTVLITSRFTNWSNIATVMPLTAFTAQETIELIRKSLHLPGIQDDVIKELNQLLQGLPLALQQAIAYIKLIYQTDNRFSIPHYIKLFKSKEKELLNFNFFDYSNDPYLKTVFTTWLVTLDKIKTEKNGQNALSVLNIMAYLYPDHIPISKFYYLSSFYRHLEIGDIDRILHLLTSYSMVSVKDTNVFMIHRLVQQILRINIESNEKLFDMVVSDTQQLLWHWNHVYKKNDDTIFHYLHFFLYMSEHKDSISSIVYGHPEKNFFDSLTFQNLKNCQYFIDLAYLKFPKHKFLTFLGKAIAYYMKLGYFFHLYEIFNYLTKQWNKKNLSRENFKYMLEYITHLENPTFKLKRFSPIKEKQINQRSSVKLYYQFMSFIFGQRLSLYEDCEAHSLKRSICLPTEIEQAKFKQDGNSAIKSHFEKIGLVSRYISSAIMTRDIFSALIQGHFEEVAFNFGLIASSSFFGKLSNNLFVQGENLASETRTLEKHSGLKSKTLDILFNEEVISVNKRQFLGKAMKVASPFVAKTTSIFFAYNLKNEIQAYKMGDKTVLPNLISNSIILSVDGIEASIEGAEFLEIITGVSAVTGPIGEWIALLVWVGTDAYRAKQQVEAIEQYVHLSNGEKFFEFLLETLHQPPLERIQVKVKNGQLVEHAVNFLKNNTAIQRFILPAFHFEADLCQIRKAFLNEKINFTLDESNPDEPAEGILFCLAASPPPYNTKNVKTTYLCHKALGVSYLLNRTGDLTLVDLGEGEDEVVAFPDFPTVFRVQNGKKKYKGSDSGNQFDLLGNDITGELQGGKGFDSLVLDNFHPENSNYLLLDIYGFLCGKNDSLIQQIPPLCPDKNRIQIDKIEQINGRKNEPDFLYLSPYTYAIDGKGGWNKEQPDSFFITAHSPKNLKITLRNNTQILFFSNTVTDSVNYSTPLNEVGEAWIQYYFTKPIQHRFLFECSLQNLDVITINNNSLLISVLANKDMNRKFFTVTLSGLSGLSNNNQTKNMEENFKNIHYLFKDIELKLINNTHLIGHEIIVKNELIDKKINLFRALANRLKKSLSIQLINNITLLIGQEKKHEIFYVNSLFESHLVGNGGENAYIILANNKTVFPIPKITLYDASKTDSNESIELINSLDFREIIKKYKETYLKAVISSHIFSKDNDLILILYNSVYSPSHSYSYDAACFSPWATIQLKDALFNNAHWYQKLDIFLNSIPSNIVPIDDEFWTLDTAPIIFTGEKKIIVITHQDIEEDTRFEIFKNIGNFAFFRNESDLILTNAITHSGDYCTISCHQFYKNNEMRKKLLSATFKFFDQEIRLQNYQREIEFATNFQYLSKIFFTNVSETVSRGFLNSINIISKQVNPESQPQKLLRHKREVNLKEEIKVNNIKKLTLAKQAFKTDQTFFPKMNHYAESRINEEDRVLAIADDYLKKYDHVHSKNKNYYRKKSIKKKRNKKKNFHLYSSAVHEKTKPIIENSSNINHKNNDNYILRNKVNNFDHNKSNLSEKSLTQRQTLRYFKPTLSRSEKERLFKESSFNKKRGFFTKKTLSIQESFTPVIKATSLAPQLTYEKRQSSSRKPNQYAVTSHIETPNIHGTVMLLDFIVKAYKGNPVTLSYEKKLNKTIKKAEKIKEKIKSQSFGKR